jgi:hypothetical protein
MGSPTIDYDALARQQGGTPVVDYDALAAQHGGTVATPTVAPPTNRSPNVVDPHGQYFSAAPAPSILDRLRGTVSNSAVGYALEQVLPKLADALNLHPTETVNSPTYQSDRQNLIAPQYLMPGNPQTQQGQKAKALLTGLGNLTNPKVAATGTAIGASAALAAPLAPVAIPTALALGGMGLGGTNAIRHASGAQYQYDQGNVDAGNAATSNLPGDLLMMLGSGAIKIPGATVPGQNYTPGNASAFEGLTAKANGMGPNFIPQSITPEALSPIRQSTSDMLENGTPAEQSIARKATAQWVKPLDRLVAVHSVIQKSLTDLEAQHTPVLQQVAGTPVDMTPIQRGLQAQIQPGMSAADIAGINDLIQRSGQITNLGDLNNFRQIMNEEASPSYRQTPTRAGQASAPQQVATDTADAVRNHYFDQMQNATVSPQNPNGIDFQPLKSQQSNLLTTKEAIERLQSPLSKAQADFNAPMTKRAVLGEIGDAIVNAVKNPKKLVQQQILRESPASSASYLIRRALADLPTATSPSAQPGSASSPYNPAQLPASATPSVIQGTPVNPPPQSPSSSPPLALTNPQGQLPPALVQLLLQRSAQPLSLPADTNGMAVTQSPSTSYPPLNADTARTRIEPTQFAQAAPAVSAGARPVTPSGQVLTPLQRFLQAGDLDQSMENPSADDLKRAILKMRSKRGK